MLAATSVETARHSDDVELISGAMCEKLGLDRSERDSVLAAARLHDIGKTSVPPEVLRKPGPLDAEEWELIRQHTVIGEQILASVNDLRGVAHLVRHSHERWDGEGYPDGLAGEQIPLGSRIVFCADAFHAIRSDRPYRPGTSADRALREVRRNSGTQFDPRVVTALTEVVYELRLAPEGRASPSPRLAALLLTFALLAGGSALGRSDLLGEPRVKGPATAEAATPGAAECQSADCSSALGPVLFEQNQALGLARDGEIGPGRIGPGSFGTPGTPDDAGQGNKNGGGAGAEDEPEGSGGSAETGGGAGTGGNAGTGGSGGSGSGGGNGKSKSNSRGSGGSPGKSGQAPGHGGSSPGNSGNAPGQQLGGPGNSDHAAGHNK